MQNLNPTRTVLRLLVGVLGLAVWLAGCSSQVGPDYRGEKLASLTANLSGQLSASSAGYDVHMVWLGENFNLVGQTWPVHSEHVGQVTLDFYEPPIPEANFLAGIPDGFHAFEALSGPDTPLLVSQGFLVVTEAGTPLRSPLGPDSPIIGGAVNYVVVYASHDIKFDPGAMPFDIQVDTLTAGYHLFESEGERWVKVLWGPSIPNPVYECLKAYRQVDQQTSIPLVLGPPSAEPTAGSSDLCGGKPVPMGGVVTPARRTPWTPATP